MREFRTQIFKRPGRLMSRDEAGTELIRKSIHLSIAFVPCFAAANFSLTIYLLVSGLTVYVIAEILRNCGLAIPMISHITAISARSREQRGFVFGPLTLGLGALCSLLFFPPQIASISIYALAFGDGLSSLVGKFFGSIKIPFTRGKSLEGSLSCFCAVYLSTYLVSGKLGATLIIALVTTLVEALPLRDLDNIAIPITTGFVAVYVLSLF